MHEATRTMLQPQLQSFLYFVLHTTIKYDTEPRSPTELQDDLLPPHGHPHHRRHLEVRRSFHRQHSPKKWDLRNQETCERSVGGEEAKLAGTTCLLTLFFLYRIVWWSTWKYQFPYDHLCRGTLRLVHIWMGYSYFKFYMSTVGYLYVVRSIKGWFRVTRDEIIWTFSSSLFRTWNTHLRPWTRLFKRPRRSGCNSRIVSRSCKPWTNNIQMIWTGSTN